jgi:hypothetical protein
MNTISYSRHGDYLLPDIILNEPPPGLTAPLGRYGRMRRTYLKEHRPIHYNTLLLKEQLFPHLRRVDETANKRLDAIMSDILMFKPPPDKAADGLAWAAHMTEVRNTAEQMMLDAVVYA